MRILMLRMPGVDVAQDIYVSDADIEMSKDVESLRIDRHLVSDLSSMMPGRRRKMLDRIEEHGRKNPLAIVPVLAKHYDHDNPKVRPGQGESCPGDAVQTGEVALVECMFSRDQSIANTAASVLEERNFNSMSFLLVQVREEPRPPGQEG